MRITLKIVLRDSFIMLTGTTLGLLLAHSFMSESAGTLRTCNNNQPVTKSFSKRRENQFPDSTRTWKQRYNRKTFNSQSMTQRYPKKHQTVREELHISSRKSLYIGVLSSQPPLQTRRAIAVNNTWGNKAPRLEFFSPIPLSDGINQLPFTRLPVVADTNPQLTNIYHMLKYMHDLYIDKYNWFMFANDNVYVRVEYLIQFLGKLDPSKVLYIGQPDGGRRTNAEQFKFQSRYCVGGPGVIFSRALLIKLAPHLKCLQNDYVFSADNIMQVNRCIRRILGVQCTSNKMMSHMFKTDYSNGQIFKTPRVYKNPTVTNALTLSPFEDPLMMFRVHQYYLEVDITNSLRRTELLRQKLQQVTKYIRRERVLI